ncbi:MAG: M23 family metallopeptidase [Steroidobacteraceae bacterium]
MNIIFLSRRQGKARHLNLSNPLTMGLSALGVIGLITGIFLLGVRWGESDAWRIAGSSAGAASALRSQQGELATMKARMQERIDALAMRLGQFDAQLLRINQLGKRLTQMANLSSREFDFDHDPPQGGPESGSAGRGAEIPDLTQMIDDFDRRLGFRTAQMNSLENVLLGRQLSAEILPSGRPVREGYVSSVFGQRMDPFSGEEAFHKGIDFAADAGTDVLAVASGIVTWAGPREGYGTLVEVTHPNGYVTRYAHNSKVSVSVGDTVERGQVLATVGSTGRSTGPHVHFEVLRNGAQIDPAGFIEH